MWGFISKLNVYLLAAILVLLTAKQSQALPSRSDKGRDLVSECTKALEAQEKKILPLTKILAEKEIADPVLLELFDKLIKLVNKNHRVPTQAELANKLSTTPTLLRQYYNLLKINETSDLLKHAWQQFPSEAARSTEYMISRAAFFLRNHGRVPTREELTRLTGTPQNQLELIYGELNDLLKQVRDRRPKDAEVARNRIIKAFVKSAKLYGRPPSAEELSGVLRLQLEDFKQFFGKNRPFKNYEDLIAVAFADPTHRNDLKDAIDTRYHSKEKADIMMEALKTKKTIVITTAVAGHSVNAEALATLNEFLEERDAHAIVIPSNMQTTGLDAELLEYPRISILTNTVELGDDYALNNIKIMAKQRDPLMGLEFIGRERGQSQIIGHPQLRLKAIHTADNEFRMHSIWSTGAITNPDYNGQKLVQWRTDSLAKSDHYLGALILEKNNGTNLFPKVDGATGSFHIRPIKFIRDKENMVKGFMDLNKFYTPTGIQKSKIKSIVLGDIHVGSTDQKLLQALKEQVLTFDPEEIILHDLFDGYSINHHERNRVVAAMQKAASGKLDLQAELEGVIAFLNSLLATKPNLKIKIIHSNHNAWLNRWLEDRKDISLDPYNGRLANLLTEVKLSKEDPFETVVLHGLSTFDQATGERTYLINPVKDFQRISFVHAGEPYRIGPSDNPAQQVDLGFHGHAGAAGSRGGIKSFRRGTNSLVYGHTHTVEIWNDAVNTGTFTPPVLPYSKDGLSNWAPALTIVGEHGEKQLLIYQDGEWYASEDEEAPEPSSFFKEGFPRILPNNDNQSTGGDTDQYGGSGSTGPGAGDARM